jgi:uncharacterized protein YgiM (DUF1202 family)
VLGDVSVRIFLTTSFLFLGLAFYELSGGSDFEAEVRQELSRAAIIDVTRDSNDLTSGFGSSTVLVAYDQTAEVDVIEEPLAVIEEEPSAAQDLVFDFKTVAGAGVNMRTGPGTSYGVADKLDRGTEVEVLEVLSTGWAHLRVVETGRVGWMAARFLDENDA